MRQWYCVLVFLCSLASVGNAQVYWQSDFGPWGGRVNDLCEDESGYLYAATMQGLYLSSDEGRSWSLLSLDGENLYDIHRTRSGILLALQDRQLIRSVDGGVTWETSMEFSAGVPIYPEPWDSGFFVHSSGALFYSRFRTSYVSTDDGVHWEEFSSSGYNIDLWSEAADGTLLTGTRLYHWPDRVEQQLPTVTMGGRVVSYYLMHATPAGTSIALLNSMNWYVSQDGGISWEHSFKFTDWHQFLRISSSPSGAVMVLHRDFGFLISSDAGRSWNPMTLLLPEMQNIYDILCTGRGELLVAAREGIFRLDPTTGTWEAQDPRHSLIPVGPLLQIPDQRIIAGLPLSNEIQELPQGGDWSTILTSDVPFNDLARCSSGILLVATDGHGVKISSDGGLIWSVTTGGEQTVNALLQLRDGRVLAGGETGLYESSDDGRNWTRLRSTQDWSIECLLERGNGEIILAGEAGIFIGSSDLKSWRTARPSWMPVMSLAEDAAGRLFAGTLDDGLYRSTDGGFSWESAGFEGQWITGIVAADASYCFLATRKDGVFESRDGGTTWHPYSTGLRSEEILDFAAGVDGYLYAGTAMGVARSSYPVLRNEYLTPDFTLSQNNPNPASGQAVFAWSIPRQGHVRMSVYDLLGRELSVVFEGSQQPGLHWQTVNTELLIPGTYFCILRYEGQMIDRKFQVLR